MSETERVGTKPSRASLNAPAPAEPAVEAVELTKSERNKLFALGYNKADLSGFSVERSREILITRERKPKANPMTGTNTDPLPASMSPKAIAERQERHDSQSSGVSVTDRKLKGTVFEERHVAENSGFIASNLDDFTVQNIVGDNVFDQVLKANEEANPGWRFRFFNPELPEAAGPAWRNMNNPNGEPIVVAGQRLRGIPESVYDEGYRKPNLAASARQMGQIKPPVPTNEDGQFTEKSEFRESEYDRRREFDRRHQAA